MENRYPEGRQNCMNGCGPATHHGGGDMGVWDLCDPCYDRAAAYNADPANITHPNPHREAIR